MTWTLGQLLSPRSILAVTEVRIADLTDEELYWEPVAGCMTVRDGVMDPLPSEPHHFDGSADPVTTIAWRLGHIVADGLLAPRNPVWLGVDATPPPADVPTDAAGLREALAHAVDWWSSLVEGLSDEHLSQPIGSVAGPYGDGPRAGFIVHLNNEVIHHGAEVGVLRDLWRGGLR